MRPVIGNMREIISTSHSTEIMILRVGFAMILRKIKSAE